MMKTTAEAKEKTAILFLEGKYDISEIIKFEGIFKETIKGMPERIALNLKNLIYIDSSGIGSIIRCMNFASRDNIAFICYDLSDPIFSVFQMAKLDQYIQIMTLEEFESSFSSLN